jgi:hypothetical protein
MMMMLSYSAYAPFNKLMSTLEEKGFMPRGSRPTVCKVGQCKTVCGMNMIRGVYSPDV